jgi:hypothetical protein
MADGPALREGEFEVDSLLVATYLYAWTEGLTRRVKGVLVLTNQRIVFLPDQSSATRPRDHWSCEVSDVREAVRAPNLGGAFLIVIRTAAGTRRWDASGWDRKNRERWLINLRGVEAGAIRRPSDAASSTIKTRTPPRLSETGTHSTAGLACPSCGGTQFRLKRSYGKGAATGAAVGTLVVGGPVLGAIVGASASGSKPKLVECIVCGEVYARGAGPAAPPGVAGRPTHLRPAPAVAAERDDVRPALTAVGTEDQLNKSDVAEGVPPAADDAGPVAMFVALFIILGLLTGYVVGLRLWTHSWWSLFAGPVAVTALAIARTRTPKRVRGRVTLVALLLLAAGFLWVFPNAWPRLR